MIASVSPDVPERARRFFGIIYELRPTAALAVGANEGEAGAEARPCGSDWKRRLSVSANQSANIIREDGLCFSGSWMHKRKASGILCYWNDIFT